MKLQRSFLVVAIAGFYTGAVLASGGADTSRAAADEIVAALLAGRCNGYDDVTTRLKMPAHEQEYCRYVEDMKATHCIRNKKCISFDAWRKSSRRYVGTT